VGDKAKGDNRGAYICQSQSMNIFMQDPNFGKLTSMHFYAWKAGLKTGMYYLRTKSAVDAVKFTVDKQALQQTAPSTAKKVEEVPLDYKGYAAKNEGKAKSAGSFVVMSEEEQKLAAMQCSLDDPEDCEMCGS